MLKTVFCQGRNERMTEAYVLPEDLSDVRTQLPWAKARLGAPGLGG